jgi:hypothetical protein
VSIAPGSINVGELALRAAVRPGAWMGLLTLEPEAPAVAGHLTTEIDATGEATARHLDASDGAAALAATFHEAAPGVLVVSGLDRWTSNEWSHLDLLRSQVMRDACVVLVLSRRAFEALMQRAPNLSSWLGGAVWTLDREADLLSAEEREERLRSLRAWSGLSDNEMLTRVERGELPLEPEHAEWLVLLGRGDLLDRA